MTNNINMINLVKIKNNRNRISPNRARIKKNILAISMLVFVGSLAACAKSTSSESATKVQLGYFPNLTHAPALIGVEEGLFSKELPQGVTLEERVFNAGPELIEAMFAGSVDIAYVGPNPAINAWAKSKGEEVAIISGSTSGGALFITQEGINTVSDLSGKILATPQLGGTQDVALRDWLQSQGLNTDKTGGGDVTIAPRANADILTSFVDKQIDGAWVPEPWATRLLQEGKGKIFLDERSLWPDKEFTTTVLIVKKDFLAKNPELVKDVLKAHVEALDLIEKDPQHAQEVANKRLQAISGKPLSQKVLEESWERLHFTSDPVELSLKKQAEAASNLGFIEPVDLTGLIQLNLLQEVEQKDGQK